MKFIIAILFTLIFNCSAFATLPQGSICVEPKTLDYSESSGSLEIRVNGAKLYYLDNAYGDRWKSVIEGFFEGISMSAQLGGRKLIVEPLKLSELGNKNVDLWLRGTKRNSERFADAVRIDFNGECNK